MNYEVYDDDANVIETISDEEVHEEMDTEQQPTEAESNNGNRNSNTRRGNRLSDQVNMDDEPEIPGYERYVSTYPFV
jgi:hypothetical protein